MSENSDNATVNGENGSNLPQAGTVSDPQQSNAENGEFSISNLVFLA